MIIVIVNYHRNNAVNASKDTGVIPDVTNPIKCNYNVA
jgi:hypothetical protein